MMAQDKAYLIVRTWAWLMASRGDALKSVICEGCLHVDGKKQ